MKNMAICMAKSTEKVAILDVDYHCGNGTISIFWDRPDVFVASMHADPSGDYPWNAASRIRLERDPVRARPSTCRSPRARVGPNTESPEGRLSRR